MDEEVLRSRELVSRRRALGIGGTIGLGSLLAACATPGNGLSGTASGTAGSAATTGPSAVTTPTTATPSATPSLSATATTASSAQVLAMLDKARTCSLTKEETQGPMWFNVDSIRTDIREKRPGTNLQLAVRVQNLSKCSAGGRAAPIANSVVEIWHCDAGGIYSGFESGSGPGGGGVSDGSYSEGDLESKTSDKATYLRGAQVTGADGTAQFLTIYPGWYPGRTVHIHLKVHIDKQTVLTTQLFMDESLNDAVFATPPYSKHRGRKTTNDIDSLFTKSGLLTARKCSDGYVGVINLGIHV